MTLLSALEIFTNPKDLEIVIGQEKKGGKYAFTISRGPGHNFKPILSSRPFAEKVENAVEIIKTILEEVNKVSTNELSSGNFVSGLLNPDMKEIEQSKVLNFDLIARILDELRKNQVASTYKMSPTNLNS